MRNSSCDPDDYVFSANQFTEYWDIPTFNCDIAFSMISMSARMRRDSLFKKRAFAMQLNASRFETVEPLS